MRDICAEERFSPHTVLSQCGGGRGSPWFNGFCREFMFQETCMGKNGKKVDHSFTASPQMELAYWVTIKRTLDQ